jgi:hypothetical protein
MGCLQVTNYVLGLSWLVSRPDLTWSVVASSRQDKALGQVDMSRPMGRWAKISSLILKHDPYRNNYRFNKFLSFIEGYMRGKEDTDLGRRDLRSPFPRGKRNYNSSKKGNRQGDFHNDSHDENHKKGRYNNDFEYMPQFTCYAQFDRIRYNLLKIVKNKYDLLKPMDISMFKI